MIFFTSRLACARRVARLTLANDLEGDEDLSKFEDVTAVWLHNKLCKFVTDEKQPDWLREMYAAMLATREHPAEADAVSDDAVMQYFFANEIIFG